LLLLAIFIFRFVEGGQGGVEQIVEVSLQTLFHAVEFGPVFLNSDLPMGRWRELSQNEVDILSAEVGLTSVAMPTMTAKGKDKMERLQRKSSRPLGRSERVVRTLRPAHDGAPAERPARAPRLEDGERPARKPRGDAPAPRRGEAPARKDGRGSAVAERPADMNKRPAKPGAQRPGLKLSDDSKRRGPAADKRAPVTRRKPKPE
jgi:23S rRNA pseudouridine2605 synthase